MSFLKNLLQGALGAVVLGGAGVIGSELARTGIEEIRRKKKKAIAEANKADADSEMEDGGDAEVTSK